MRAQINFSKFIGESKRFAFTYGLTVNLNICDFPNTIVSVDTRLNLGLKYRFYLGGYNAPVISMKDDYTDKNNSNTSSTWRPNVNSY